MTLAVIQMTSHADIPGNLANARQLLAEAAERGARLAVLPENFAAMGRSDLAAVGRAEAEGNGPILPWLKQVARDLGLWIVAGTLPLPPDDRPQTVTLKRWRNGEFEANVLLMRPEIYNGQTCESTGQPFSYIVVLGYFECAHIVGS